MNGIADPGETLQFEDKDLLRWDWPLVGLPATHGLWQTIKQRWTVVTRAPCEYLILKSVLHTASSINRRLIEVFFAV